VGRRGRGHSLFWVVQGLDPAGAFVRGAFVAAVFLFAVGVFSLGGYNVLTPTFGGRYAKVAMAERAEGEPGQLTLLGVSLFVIPQLVIAASIVQSRSS
jgi:hypothetical protein